MDTGSRHLTTTVSGGATMSWANIIKDRKFKHLPKSVLLQQEDDADRDSPVVGKFGQPEEE